MFVRVDNFAIDLDEICGIKFYPQEDSLQKPFLRVFMKNGQNLTVRDEEHPELVMNMIIDALDSIGQIYNIPYDEPGEEIELSELEAEQLRDAYEKGMAYIARDKSGQLFAHARLPEKNAAEWLSFSSTMRLNDELFDFVDFDDEAPKNIMELLLGK